MKKRLVVAVLFLLCVTSKPSKSQTYQGQRNQILATNVLSNGLVSGIGGIIHKKKGEKTLPVFLKSFGKGCVGGLIKYSAKSNNYYFRNDDNVIYAPLNRAFFFLGHSMVMNGSRNERLLENYYCNFYGLNFTYSAYKPIGNRLKIRGSLGTLGAAAVYTIKGHKFNFYKTLEYGNLYFDMPRDFEFKGWYPDGLATFNVMSIKSRLNGGSGQRIVPHELGHIFQNYDWFSIGNFYNDQVDKELSRYKLYKTLSRYFRLDYESLFHAIPYALQPKPTYFKNYFEFEAEHFARRTFIRR